MLVYLSIDPPFVHWSISIPNVNVYEYVPIYRFSPQRAAAAFTKCESSSSSRRRPRRRRSRSRSRSSSRRSSSS